MRAYKMPGANEQTLRGRVLVVLPSSYSMVCSTIGQACFETGHTLDVFCLVCTPAFGLLCESKR